MTAVAQAELEEYGRIVGALAQLADEQSLEGRPAVANALVSARQALRGLLTRLVELQRTAELTDEILSVTNEPRLEH